MNSRRATKPLKMRRKEIGCNYRYIEKEKAQPLKKTRNSVGVNTCKEGAHEFTVQF